MMDWWQSLTAVNQWFYIIAAIFTLFFLWQLVMAIIGLGGGGEDLTAAHTDIGGIEADHADHPDMQHAATDAHETMAAFKLLSVRSILAFCMLFTWAGALYMNGGLEISVALLYAFIWGMVAMIMVTLLLYLIQRMTETGTPQISTCLGTEGVIYLDIPAGGQGEVRVTVSSVVTHVKAKAINPLPIKAGTRVRVTRILGPTLVEVEPAPV